MNSNGDIMGIMVMVMLLIEKEEEEEARNEAKLTHRRLLGKPSDIQDFS